MTLLPRPTPRSPLAARTLAPRAPSTLNKSHKVFAYSSERSCSLVKYGTLIVCGTLSRLVMYRSHWRLLSPSAGTSMPLGDSEDCGMPPMVYYSIGVGNVKATLNWVSTFACLLVRLLSSTPPLTGTTVTI